MVCEVSPPRAGLTCPDTGSTGESGCRRRALLGLLGVEVGADFLIWECVREEPALVEVDADVVEGVELAGGFDTFGHAVAAHGVVSFPRLFGGSGVPRVVRR